MKRDSGFKIRLFLIVLTIAVVAVSFLAGLENGVAQGGCGECGQHCAKVEAPGPFVFDVEAWGPNESTIKSVYVSAGEFCSVFTSDTENWCYAVSGIGGKVASARMIPTSAECPVIDYVLFNWSAPFLTLTPEPTNTAPPSPWETPTGTPLTATPTPWMVTQPPRPSPSPTPEITNTPPGTPETPTPVATGTPEATPTHPPKSGSIRLFGYCVNEDGSHGVDYEKFWIDTNNMGPMDTPGELNGYAWPPVGHVGTWATPRDTGTTVLDAGPGVCWRGGDDYPADQTRYDLQAQPVFGGGNVGNSAVVCERPCISTIQTFELPNSGGVRPYGNRR